jgi:hypothetical protein
MSGLKIKGYTQRINGLLEGFEQAPDEQGPWIPCTMVLLERPHERVFTESEVLDMLSDIKRADFYYGEGNTIEVAARKLGLRFNKERIIR